MTSGTDSARLAVYGTALTVLLLEFALVLDEFRATPKGREGQLLCDHAGDVLAHVEAMVRVL